jgi:tRNA threonylcarbamoyladenosine biosynthesis protein TsaB
VEEGVIVLGIDTSTGHASIALGTEHGTLAAAQFESPRRQDDLVPAIQRLLDWSGTRLSSVGGIAVGLGPGLYTGLRVGIEVGRSLAQVLNLPIVGISSLDVLAFPFRTARLRIAAVLDARRSEVFFAFYRSVPGGIVREGTYRVDRPEALAAELVATPEEVLLVGNGAILYRRELEEPGSRVAFAPAALATPWAPALVEVTAPRFIREQTGRPNDVVPLYLRKTDAEIAWDQRARGASA